MRVKSRGTVYLAILLGFAVRVFYLDQRGLWYDEAFAILYSSRSFAEILSGTLTQVAGAAADVHPLFYYFSLHVWMRVAGASPFAARFFSLFLGVATIPVAFCLARRLFDRRTAVAAVLVLAIAPFHIAYSQESRMYAQLGFWTALALYAFVRFWRGQRRVWWFVFVVSGACALYSHNLAGAIFAALGAWVIYDAFRRRETRLLRATILGGLGMLVLWLPWLVFLPSQFGKIEQAYWVPPPTLTTLVQTLLVFAFDFDNGAPPAALLPLLLFGALLIGALVLFEILRRARAVDGDGRQALVFAGTMALVPVFLIFAISQWRSVYIIRGLMPSFLFCVLLVGWALTGMPRRAAAVAGLAFAALVLAVLPAYYTYANFPRSPFKEAAAALDSRGQPGDAVVHDNKLSFFPMYYYDRVLAQAFIADPAGAASDTLANPTQAALGLYATNLDAATRNRPRIWFIIFQAAIDQADEQGQAQANLAWMEKHFRQVSLDRFNDLNVYLFEP